MEGEEETAVTRRHGRTQLTQTIREMTRTDRASLWHTQILKPSYQKVEMQKGEVTV